MQLLVCSDNHGDRDMLEMIVRKHPSIDIYIHAGDSEFTPDELAPFISVKGNNDYFMFPVDRVINTGVGILYICHGHLLEGPIEKIAERKNASLAIHGHTHRRRFDIKNGVTIVCPGALSHPRGNDPISYAIITKEAIDTDWEVTFYSLD